MISLSRGGSAEHTETPVFLIFYFTTLLHLGGTVSLKEESRDTMTGPSVQSAKAPQYSTLIRY